jgi:hypothetical protein
MAPFSVLDVSGTIILMRRILSQQLKATANFKILLSKTRCYELASVSEKTVQRNESGRQLKRPKEEAARMMSSAAKCRAWKVSSIE